MLFASVKSIVEYGRLTEDDKFESREVIDIAINPDCVAAIRPAEINAAWSEILLAGNTKWVLVEAKVNDLTEQFCEVKKMGERENIKSLFAALARAAA